MHHVSRKQIADLNENLACGICFGYIINATTIIECLHSFCRSCLVLYLQQDNCCPLCGQLVHKTKPLEYIRPDAALQAIVYKLVPGLLQNEMQRRRQFYSDVSHADAADTEAEISDINEDLLSHVEPHCDEQISVCLELASISSSVSDTATANVSAGYKRYLLCSSYLPVTHLQKFVRLKFDLPSTERVSIFYTDEELPDSYTLADIAELYSWRRNAPLRLMYVVGQQVTTQQSPNTPRYHSTKQFIKLRRKYHNHRRRKLNFVREQKRRLLEINDRNNSDSVTKAITDDVWSCQPSSFDDYGNVDAEIDAADDEVFSINRKENFHDESNRAVRQEDLTENRLSTTPVPMTTSTPAIWRLVDDRLEQSDSGIETSAQIFSRSEDEMLFSPRFYGNTGDYYSKNVRENCARTVTATPTSHAIANDDSQGSSSVSSPVLTSTYHFKKRMLLNTSVESAAASDNKSHCYRERVQEPVVIGKRTSVAPFSIHQDHHDSSPASGGTAPNPPVLKPLAGTLSELSKNCRSEPPAKIGIVISHGRAMTLQDKMQRMSCAMNSPHAADVSTSTPVTRIDMPLSCSSAPSGLHQKMSVGHRSHRRHKRAVSKRRTKLSFSSIQTQNQLNVNENDSGSQSLTSTTSTVTSSTGLPPHKRHCVRKRSELQLLLQLDGGPLAASAEFRRANALRSRDNHQYLSSAVTSTAILPAKTLPAICEKSAVTAVTAPQFDSEQHSSSSRPPILNGNHGVCQAAAGPRVTSLEQPSQS